MIIVAKFQTNQAADDFNSFLRSQSYRKVSKSNAVVRVESNEKVSISNIVGEAKRFGGDVVLKG
jgi:hypothetical protein